VPNKSTIDEFSTKIENSPKRTTVTTGVLALIKVTIINIFFKSSTINEQSFVNPCLPCV